MKEDLLENIAIPEGEIYTTRTIVISCFFGGMLASGFMIYQNFKTFGEHKKASTSLLVTILGFAGIMFTAFIPALDKIPGIVFTAAITLVTSFLTKKYQGDLIQKHISADGKIYSFGRVFLICIISALLLIAFIFGIYFLQDAAAGQS